MKYEFFEHTADTKFRAYGKTLEEAFGNAALATTEVMTDVDKIDPKIEKTIEVEANKKEKLLYEFLSELIVLLDTEGFFVSEVSEIKIKEEDGKFILNARVKGDSDPKYEVKTQIKAVTYSEMFIKEEPDNVVVQVVHDI